MIIKLNPYISPNLEIYESNRLFSSTIPNTRNFLDYVKCCDKVI